MLRGSSAIIFVLLLLLGQAALLAHEYNAETHDIDKFCQICLHADHIKDTIQSKPVVFAAQREYLPVPFRGHPVAGESVVATFHARAPPLTA